MGSHLPKVSQLASGGAGMEASPMHLLSTLQENSEVLVPDFVPQTSF